MTFASIGTMALIVLAWLFAALPAIRGEGKFSLADLPRMLRRKSLLGMFLLALLFSTAYFTSFSYFEPFLKDHVHLHPQKITIVLALFGIASLAGSAIFSFLYNRFPRMIFNGSILLLGACQLLIKLGKLFIKLCGILPAFFRLCALCRSLRICLSVTGA